jgi:hypothetical protein
LITVRAEEDGYISSYRYGSTLLVDASVAPKYRIDVTRDLFGRDEPHDGETDHERRPARPASDGPARPILGGAAGCTS